MLESVDRVRSKFIKIYAVLNINDQKYRSIGILPKYFIDLDVMRLEGVSSGIPPDKFLLLTDLDKADCTFFIMSNMLS